MSLTHKQRIGQIGENIAVKHLKRLKFKILDRNYRKKWGEIDIIAEKNEANSILKRVLRPRMVLHFIEVKSVSIETLSPSVFNKISLNNVSSVSFKDMSKSFTSKVSIETLFPEENIHSWKKKRLSRAIRTYLAEKKISYETEFQIDVMAIFINLKDKKAKIRFTENVII